MVTKIPVKQYKQMVKHMPLVCVDGIVINGDSFLVVKRTKKPCKGQWFIPGGRVFKGEKVKDAFQRKMKEELGIEIDNLHEWATMEFSAKDSEYGCSTGGVDIIFLTYISPHTKIKLDDTSSSYKWIKTKHLERELRKMGLTWI